MTSAQRGDSDSDGDRASTGIRDQRTRHLRATNAHTDTAQAQETDMHTLLPTERMRNLSLSHTHACTCTHVQTQTYKDKRQRVHRPGSVTARTGSGRAPSARAACRCVRGTAAGCSSPRCAGRGVEKPRAAPESRGSASGCDVPPRGAQPAAVASTCGTCARATCAGCGWRPVAARTSSTAPCAPCGRASAAARAAPPSPAASSRGRWRDPARRATTAGCAARGGGSAHGTRATAQCATGTRAGS